MNIPTDLKYTDSHEWVRIEGNVATVGVTDHAQSELGDVVFIENPAVGRQVKAGDSIGSVESVKTVSDIYAPLSGEVVGVNDALGGQSELVNSDPYGSGFLYKIRVSDPSEVEKLHDASAYQGLIG